MSKYAQMSKVSKKGSVDSKYFGNTEKFERDVEGKLLRTKEFKIKLKNLIIEDPNMIEQRYKNAIEVFLEIKKEFDL